MVPCQIAGSMIFFGIVLVLEIEAVEMNENENEDEDDSKPTHGKRTAGCALPPEEIIVC